MSFAKWRPFYRSLNVLKETKARKPLQSSWWQRWDPLIRWWVQRYEFHFFLRSDPILYWHKVIVMMSNFVVISCTVSCHNDNLRYHHWRQSWCHDNPDLQGVYYSVLSSRRVYYTSITLTTLPASQRQPHPVCVVWKHECGGFFCFAIIYYKYFSSESMVEYLFTRPCPFHNKHVWHQAIIWPNAMLARESRAWIWRYACEKMRLSNGNHFVSTSIECVEDICMQTNIETKWSIKDYAISTAMTRYIHTWQTCENIFRVIPSSGGWKHASFHPLMCE